VTGAGRGTPERETEDVPRIAVLDYGVGNLRSVEKALARVGTRTTITGDPASAAEADGLLLPGVGAFGRAIGRVRELELDRLIDERVAAGTPVLGICLGFQLLFESSTELGGGRGLGLIEGEVTVLEAPGLKVPHIGWEPVSWSRRSELSAGIADRTSFYFAHGFAPRPAVASDELGTAVHGERFCCAVARPPVYGVQFHPEKSSAAGLRLLANFAAICAGRAQRPDRGAGIRPTDAARA
jgi:glutamine amidotransferase